MDIPSVSLLRPLVNQAYLGWRHLRRLPAAPLWWLWLATTLAHLLSLLGGVIVPYTEGVITSEPDNTCVESLPQPAACASGTGLVHPAAGAPPRRVPLSPGSSTACGGSCVAAGWPI